MKRILCAIVACVFAVAIGGCQPVTVEDQMIIHQHYKNAEEFHDRVQKFNDKVQADEDVPEYVKQWIDEIAEEWLDANVESWLQFDRWASGASEASK